MTKRKIFLITVLFVLMITGFRMLWFHYYQGQEYPEAKKGVLDLRGWDLQGRETIPLKGEWEFYAGNLSKPDLLKSLSAKEQQWIRVPGKWNAALHSPDSTAYGFGSYRLLILTDSPKAPLYGLRIPRINTASNLFVNGQLISKEGQVADKPEHHIGSIVPYSAIFEADGNAIEIVIQASNFDFPANGGIAKSIMFGSAEAVSSRTNFSITMQLIVCIILLLHGLYAGIIFFMGPHKKSLLYFSGIVVFTVLSILTDDDRLLLSWLPVSLELTLKMLLLSYTGIALCILKFAQLLLVRSRIIQTVFAGQCIFAILILFMPPQEISSFLMIMLLLGITTFCVTIPLFAFFNTFRGQKGAIFLLLASISIGSSILWGVLKTVLWNDLPYYPWDIVLAFLGFASYWFKHFFQTNTELRSLSDRLQRTDQVKNDFLANTSHELRNPLHGMINIAQSVLDSQTHTLDERNRSNMQLLITVGRRMSLLLNDLLDVTRLRERDIRLEKRSLKPQGVASGVLDMLRFMTDGKSLEMVISIPDHFPNVLADENRLVQIFFNLLHNAVKYTNAGTISIQADIRDGMAHIHVRDTGVGMDEETQQRIFQPYEQGTSHLTVIGDGLGLGLSISKQLIELHGGTLRVHSEVGKGSVFTFTLPLDHSPVVGEIPGDEGAYMEYAAPILPSKKAAMPVATGTPRSRILAVDDDPVNLKILEGILATDAYDIVTVTSGEEALRILDHQEWDLVIADVMMPQMSGYELTRRVREYFAISELPVLLLTTRSQREDLYTGFLAGANDYITKPVDSLELKSRVHALTEVRRSASERLRMEAAWLQAQIRPHFLFNTLNTIVSLSETDGARMIVLIEEFGKYLRGSFNSRNLDRVVSLEYELALLRSYLYIEKERFGNRLNIVWEVDEELNLHLPPLSIQPLAENAVRHGILKRIRGGTLHIRITDHAKGTEIAIIDDGVGMDQEKLDNILTHQNKERGVGLLNTDRRLKQMYGDGLHISSHPDQGTTVSFHIPREKKKED
ncbi:response regulator [Paenibacillus sp. 28ISP30-2]|nr:response regulator [Paenibacillus sp. 28ISP30-2]